MPPHTTAQQWVAAAAAGDKFDRVAFTTGPFGRETHWKQVFMLNESPSAAADVAKDREISGEITFSVPDGNRRALTLRVDWTGDGAKKQTQSWALH